MNELNTRLLEYLPDPNTVKGGIGSVVESLQVEAPLLVQEILRWNFAKSFIMFLACLVAGIGLLIITKALWKLLTKLGNESTDAEGFRWLVLVAGPGFFIIFVVGLIEHLTWLQIWIAPRLFLLEYVSDLMK